MSSTDTTPREASAIVERYRSIGLVGGLFVGGLAAAMIGGPHFSDWSMTRSLVTLLGSVGLGGLIGYIAAEIAIGSQASGPGIGDGDHSGDHAQDGSASGGDGGGGGDSGGGAGGDP
ncbi:hypothetical protein DSM104443_00538 [Usitatibacter rugosus]|uniref:Uncharacterized protein n=1 Tax=Usitatibacter rugosus TaxID=2732067 RepID=A0A6M4GSQ0_9PROT|nr:hypothetical protein [Usitatibacter rugosus]QJR09494.1 hypothetical protein DSM104443_00538 [Usitatibacter rugosus]